MSTCNLASSIGLPSNSAHGLCGELDGDPFSTANPIDAFYPLVELKAMTSMPMCVVLSDIFVKS